MNRTFDFAYTALSNYMRRAGLIQQALFEQIRLRELERTDSGHMSRNANINIGNVAYGSLGTSGVSVAGTTYVSEIYIPRSRTVTGMGLLNGTIVGTDNVIYALYGPGGGKPLAWTALAGTLSAGADAFQEIAFTSPRRLTNDGRYWLALQVSGTTATHRRMAANTFLNRTTSFTGTFGTLGVLTEPTTFTATAGPIGYVY